MSKFTSRGSEWSARRMLVGRTPRRRHRPAPSSRTAPIRTFDLMNTLAPPTLDVPAWVAPAALAARADNATKIYGRGGTQVLALDDVTVGLPAGRFTAVMGPSGSGKSTLMHCLAGLDSLTSGQAFIGDVELGRLSDRELTRLRRERVGFVFQSFKLLPTLDAAENIRLPMALAG